MYMYTPAKYLVHNENWIAVKRIKDMPPVLVQTPTVYDTREGGVGYVIKVHSFVKVRDRM